MRLLLHREKLQSLPIGRTFVRVPEVFKNRGCGGESVYSGIDYKAQLADEPLGEHRAVDNAPPCSDMDSILK